MLGIVLNLPPFLANYIATTSPITMASQALLVVGWIPIFGVLIWGFIEIWVDHKQGQYNAHIEWVLLNISVPAGAINTPKGMENFFNNLAGSKSAITWKEAKLLGKFQAYFSLEIVGCEGDVKFYIRTPTKYRDLVEAALYAQYPEAHIVEAPDYVDKAHDHYPNDHTAVFGSEMKLSKPSYYPLRTYVSFEHMGEKDMRFKDPLHNIIEVLGKMRKEEYFWIQIVIQQPDEQEWAKEGEKYLDKMMGKEEKHKETVMGTAMKNVAWLPNQILAQSVGLDLMGGGAHGDEKKDDFRMFRMTPTERLVSDAIAEKISKIGWATKIRVLYSASHKQYRKPLIAAMIKGMFHPYAHLNMNKLGMHDHATPKDDYFWLNWEIHHRMHNLVHRYKTRQLGAGASPYYLNSEELASLFHFPAADARTPILATSGARRGEAPLELPFADEGAADLQDWQGSQKEKATHTHEEKASVAALVVPTPHAPGHSAAAVQTASQQVVPHHVDDFMPQPGKPAPLPPGLSLAEEPITDDDDAPANLPVL